MYHGLEVNLKGFEGTIFLLFFSYLFGILTAANIKGGNRGYFILCLRKWASFLLFLFPFKKKVSFWAVVIQICNYIALASAIIVYRVIDVNSDRAEGLFKLIIGSYLGICTLLQVFDIYLHDKRNKYY